MHNSASITHDGIKCPSLKCTGFLTLDDIKALIKASIAPQNLTETDYSRIEVFIQDAQVLHSAPADAIVYCSVRHESKLMYVYHGLDIGIIDINIQFCYSYSVCFDH
jgi:hypothetical protein